MASGNGAAFRVVVLLVLFSVLQRAVHAAINADPVPPFQWLNITGLLQGTTRPPGLKDAMAGYDETSRSLIIFGGEASSSVAQGQTYLLNLDSLTWSVPTPPATLTQTPPPRSAAVHGCDTAASNRNGFIVIGGKDKDGAALSDVWEFDFTNQFWSQVNISPGGPSPRWGSSGGIDTRVPPVSDPILPGPNNTFWLWGGSDGKTTFADLWRLNVSGTLSSNLPDKALGSWEQLPLATMPGVVGQGGGVITQQIVTSGGCNDTTNAAESCAVQATYLINAGSTSSATETAALTCPAPRLSPVVVPNGNTKSTTFSSQMLVLMGTFNNTLWNDGGGLQQGEVAIMNVMTQSWTRILPAGDPGSTGKESFPTPREGAVAVMYPQALVGDTRGASSDIIIFGGKDESGTYLSEVWVLRAYNGVVTQADPKWSGFGNGKLQTGVDANGAGVQNTFITSCASALAIATSPTDSTPNSTSSSSPSSSSSSSNSTSPGGGETLKTSQFDASLLHKLLAPISVALLLPSFLIFRFTSRFFNSSLEGALSQTWLYPSILLAAAGFGLGVAAIATSFTSFTSSTATRPPPLSTPHGRAGLALFLLLYCILPLFVALLVWFKSAKPPHEDDAETSRKRADSDISEKDPALRSTRSPSPTVSNRRRTHSWGPSSWRKAGEDSLSIASGSAEMGESFQSAPPAQRTFEVLNRPARTRHASGSRQGMPSADIPQYGSSHSYGDLDWLNRRRSLTAVGELDFHYTPTIVAPVPCSTPGTLLETPLQPTTAAPPSMPPLSAIVSRFLFHAILLAFCIFTLVTLWSKAPTSAFAVFLAWTAAFYFIVITLAWRGKPNRSILSLLLRRLRTDPGTAAPRPSVSDTPEPDENAPFPYIHHRPAFRRALLPETMAPQSMTDTDEEDDDRAENEMRRRDISIVSSYPKRALRITNPGPS